MGKIIELIGTWWFATEPDYEISGVLKIDESVENTLTLVGKPPGFFKLLNYWSHSRSGRKNIILLGVTERVEKITLYGLVFRTFSGTREGFCSLELIVEKIFLGIHFPTEDVIAFKKIKLNYLDFSHWLRISGFEVEKPKEGIINIKYEQPANLTIDTEMGFQLEYIFNTAFFKRDEFEADTKVTQINEVGLKGAEKINYALFSKLVSHFTNFLSFAYQGTMLLKSVKAFTGFFDNENEDNLETGTVTIYDADFKYAGGRERMPYYRLSFTYEDIADSPGKYLGNWFKKRDTYRHVFSLYFGDMDSQGLDMEYKLLTLARAAEVYHRTKYGEEAKYQSNNDYRRNLMQEFIRVIPPGLEPPGFRESILNKLRFMNEYSFNKRIKELLSEYSDITPLEIENPDLLARNLADVRNYFTHFDTPPGFIPPNDSELRDLYSKLRYLLRICLLSEIGFPKPKIKEILSRKEIVSFYERPKLPFF